MLSTIIIVKFFSRHEKFAKSIKTGFSCLFVCEATPDIQNFQHTCNNTMIIGTTVVWEKFDVTIFLLLVRQDKDYNAQNIFNNE